MTAALVALGALLGAPARFVLDVAVSRRLGRRLPWGTLVVNISGSAVFGFLAGLSAGGHLPSRWLALLGTGFCGAFTTVSAFAWETVELGSESRPRSAAAYAVGSVLAGLGMAAAGFALGTD